MFENPRRGRQARNFTTNVPKLLVLKWSSSRYIPENCRWVPLWHLLLYNFNLAKSVIHFKEINRRNSILGCTISSDLKWKSLFDVLCGSCQELESVGMNKLWYELDENEKLDVVRGEGEVTVSREVARETGFFLCQLYSNWNFNQSSGPQ